MRSTIRTPAAKGRRGFTLVELSVVLVVIVILVSLVMVAAGRALRSSRTSAERLLLVSLRQATEQFKQQFGFPPPLVNDEAFGPRGPGPGPLPPGGIRQPVVRDSAFLRSDRNPLIAPPVNMDAPRYSEYSLTYYLIGVLDSDDMSPSNNPIDGVAGAGFTRPNEDGTFTRKGQTIAPFVDAGVRKRLVTENPGSAPPDGKVTIVDRWYVPALNPPASGIRYYRWLPGVDEQGKPQYLVPRTVGDPNTNQDLRNATFAIVSLGPDGRTHADPGTGWDFRPLPKTGTVAGVQTAATAIDATFTADNIVEPGQ